LNKVQSYMVHNNLRTRVHNYPETLILIYSTHQSITYGIMKSIHISIMSKLIIVDALVRRILWRHWHVVLILSHLSNSWSLKARPLRMVALCPPRLSVAPQPHPLLTKSYDRDYLQSAHPQCGREPHKMLHGKRTIQQQVTPHSR
jgi:hypothetical protein